MYHSKVIIFVIKKHLGERDFEILTFVPYNILLTSFIIH